MYLVRKIDADLLHWKDEKKHKPLLIRGARQVGKTRSVRELSKYFSNFIEINFEESPRMKVLFEDDLDPSRICENIAAIFNQPITASETLLFFDEIQLCPKAIMSLRFFYEKMPNLHIIAAGSLLEFALSELPTFGVGRIRSIFMYPLSYFEFLNAIEEKLLLKKIISSSPEYPLNPLLHKKALDLVRKFMILGGLPEVIANYSEDQNLQKSNLILNDVIISLQSDFAKYNKKVPTSRIHEVFMSAVLQSGKKFVYTKAGENLKIHDVKEAIELLNKAALIIKVTHSSCNGIPLGAEVNHQRQKLLIFDTGIFQKLVGLNLADYLLSDDFKTINRGNMAEQFVGLELLKSGSSYQNNALYYWSRESKSSNSEVDYVISHDEKIIPVEVKAGTKGSMQSLFIFLNEKKLEKGVRISSENFAKFDKIDVYPLYAVENLIKNDH